MENIQDTTYDFVLVLRQMYTEAILRDGLSDVGCDYYQSTECVGFEVDDSEQADTYAVTSTFNDKTNGRTLKLKR
jgi:phenol 2-monooxygenase (NADPH)